MHAPKALDDDTREALAGHLVRLKHDLGKYVAFQLRWLPPEASLQDRREALAADLVATRRGPEGSLDAARVWAGLRPPLVGAAPLANGSRVDLSAEPCLQRIDAGIAVVRSALPTLADGTADAETLDRATGAALDIAEACRDWVRQMRRS